MHAQAHDHDPAAHALALREVVAVIRAELIDLGGCADDLQAAIGAIVGRVGASLAIDEQVKLQAVDALTQRLGRLAALAGALEAQIPADWVLDPASARAAASALVRVGDPAPRGPQDEGDCELF